MMDFISQAQVVGIILILTKLHMKKFISTKIKKKK